MGPPTPPPTTAPPPRHADLSQKSLPPLQQPSPSLSANPSPSSAHPQRTASADPTALPVPTSKFNARTAPANVKRSRSITFLPMHSPSKSPLTGPWSPSVLAARSSTSKDMASSSSGGPVVGETTPILSSERGGGRDYRAFEGLGPPARRASAASVGPRGEEGGKKVGEGQGPRRRKGSGGGGRRASGAEGVQGEGEGGWWEGFVEKYGSVELDNKGSVARDHLALERTFLAWLRTSLAFASIGIAVTQLFRLNTTISDGEGLHPAPTPPGTIRLRQVGKPLGATFLGISILVLMVGGRRYFESQYWIIRGKFPASRGSVCLITFVAAALIVTSLVVVCTVHPTQFQGN